MGPQLGWLPVCWTWPKHSLPTTTWKCDSLNLINLCRVPNRPALYVFKSLLWGEKYDVKRLFLVFSIKKFCIEILLNRISEIITAQRAWQYGFKQRTSQGIQCWSCQQGSYPGQNFGPEECQKFGKWIQCAPNEVTRSSRRINLFQTSLQLIYIFRLNNIYARIFETFYYSSWSSESEQ